MTDISNQINITPSQAVKQQMSTQNVDYDVGDSILVNWLANRPMGFKIEDIVDRGIQICQYLDATIVMKLDPDVAKDKSQYHHVAKIGKVNEDGSIVVGQALTKGFSFATFTADEIKTYIDAGIFHIRKPNVQLEGVMPFMINMKGTKYGFFNCVRIGLNVLLKVTRISYIFGGIKKYIALLDYILESLSARTEICSEADARTDYSTSNKVLNISQEFLIHFKDVMPLHYALTKQYSDRK